jgi:hypothetical protein
MAAFHAPSLRQGVKPTPVGTTVPPAPPITATPTLPSTTLPSTTLPSTTLPSNSGPPTTATPKPTAAFPIRAAFYYPWFPEHWASDGRLDTLFWPLLGLYNSSNQPTISTHIQQMLYGHINVGIASWWSKGSPGDQRMPALLQAAHGTPFKWTIYYDSEAYLNNSEATVHDNLLYIQKQYANDPNYLKIDGKMVVFVYTSWSQDCSVVDKYRQANVGINAYLNFNIVPNWQQCANQPDSWHTYNPTLRETSNPHLVNGKWVTDGFTISPGFSPYYNSAVCTDAMVSTTHCLPRNPSAWSQDIANMQQSGAKWQLITTFNEWNEGTSIEPSANWTSTSGKGTYLDALAAAPPPRTGP